MVGLDGDFIILTCCEGTHGWAVTKLMSFAREYVYSLPSSKSIFVTVKVTEAVYEWIWGVVGVGLLVSDIGVAPWCSVGVVWTESTGAQSIRPFNSTSRFGGALSRYMFSNGMMKSAGKTDEGSASPRTLDSFSTALLPQIRAFLST